MRYMTTRADQETDAIMEVLSSSVAPDGGLYIPCSVSAYTHADLESFVQLGFAETVAKILNQFFSAQLNGWDIEFCLGRNPIKYTNPGRKVLAVQTWHNPGGSYRFAVEEIYKLLRKDLAGACCGWAKVAISTAIMFGVYTELRRCDAISCGDVFDISVRAGDFTQPVAALYCKKMGMPIGKIIICTTENSAIWDLVNHAQFGTSLLKPEQKIGMERLICGIYGHEETLKYKAACDRHGVYSLPEEDADKIGDSIFAAVIGTMRIGTIASSVQRTSGCRLNMDAAVCYAGIQDYRAKTGQGSVAILFSHVNPESE